MKPIYKISIAIACAAAVNANNTGFAQNNINRLQHDDHLIHGIQQYEDGHFVQAIHSLEHYLNHEPLSMVQDKKITAPHHDKQRAMYYLILAKIKYGTEDMEEVSKSYIDNTVNVVYRDRVSYQLAKHYFYKQDYASTIKYYEMIDMNNLNNDEIAALKFELAYSYFVNSDFDQAYRLFAAIKEIEDGPYYYPGNYYFGLLSYNKKDYNQALRSFKKIEHLPEYAQIVPYYILEIYYFNNEFDKIIAEAPKYINAEEKLFYHNDLHLLLAKVYYEKKEYDKALPYYKYYYDNSEKIRKENLYEYAFTNYSLGHFNQSIEFFKHLSNGDDSLAQNSMYLLGDSYLKIHDKAGAKNAFYLAQNINQIPNITQAAHFLYAKLAYDLGDYTEAVSSFNSYIHTYPQSADKAEAQEHLVTLLSKSNNYDQAYTILKDMNIQSSERMKGIFQKVTLARGLQVLKSSNQKESALHFFNESLKYPINKDVEATAYFWRSYIQYEMKDYKKSETDIQQYLKIVNNNDKNVTKISKEASLKNAHTHLGYVNMALEKYESAQTNFAQAGKIETPISDPQSKAVSHVLQADAALMNKNFMEADKLYVQAFNEKYEDPAYILYQRALIAGVQNNNEEKINLLNNLIKNYPQSPYHTDAQYELASAYNLENKSTPAITILNDLIKNNAKGLGAKSLILLASIYQKDNNATDAIKTYQTLVKTYPQHPNNEQHLETLYALYIMKQDPKGYQDFIRDNHIKSDKNITEEQGFYDIAEAKYINLDFIGAIDAFKNFQNKYPESNLMPQVDYYLAQSYSKIYKFSEAKNHYGKLLNTSDEGLKMLSLMNLAKIENADGNFTQSQEYLMQLYALESRDNLDSEILFVELKNLNHLDKFAEFETALGILEDNSELSIEEKDWITLFSANSDMHLNPNNALLSTYESLMKNAQGQIAAEARVRKAQLLLKLNMLTEAEKACDFAIDKNNDYNFWLVKAYIVIADVLAAQKDYVSARATIQSVINNVKDPILKSQAENVLNKMNEEEKQNSNVLTEE